MESSSLNNRILATFIQIKNAIVQILKWNEDIQSSEDYYLSEEGMKILAASCMMIEAIGEGIKKNRLFIKTRTSSRKAGNFLERYNRYTEPYCSWLF